MHRSDCIKVVAFTVNVLKAAPTATPESVCRMLSAAAVITRLNRLDAGPGLANAQRRQRLDAVRDSREIAKAWGGVRSITYTAGKSPVRVALTYGGKRLSIAVPVIY